MLPLMIPSGMERNNDCVWVNNRWSPSEDASHSSCRWRVRDDLGACLERLAFLESAASLFL